MWDITLRSILLKSIRLRLDLAILLLFFNHCTSSNQNGSKIGMNHSKHTSGKNIEMNVLIYIHYQISNYSSLINDLQRDLDDDEILEKTDTLEIPFLEDFRFKSSQ